MSEASNKEEQGLPDKVVRLFGEPLSFEPVPEIVERLEYLLELAKGGSLRAIGYATVKAGEDNIHSVGFGAMWALGQIYNLTAAISALNGHYSVSVANWIMAGEGVQEEEGPPKAAG
jgi:hypothetical protein